MADGDDASGGVLLLEPGAEAGGHKAVALAARDPEIPAVGLTWAEVKRAHPALHAAREADRWNFRPPGGESYSLVAARLGAWLEEQDPSRCIVAVGHGLAGRILRGLYANLDPAEIPSLGEPQDVVYRLTDGVVQEFKAAPD